ncbi:DUF302 domain-containing protein [Thiocystis violacea]|uniref:DUF302 domain-containing protein n=1 Tax=Thiocystis violacea TaxID=13725 RepID=UPI00190747B2|nr:DUF302 domain-containing protein [Thiocystis violacea]MBK1718792.1 hypothetical protein [Thiocystis violacea]
MSYAFGVEIDLPFAAALEKLQADLHAEKLGVVSDINVAAILKNKLGEEIGEYRILGACAPMLAKRVIDSQPVAGTLLPCNVVVRQLSESRTAIDFMDPVTVLALADDDAANAVAEEARGILMRVVERLKG